MRDFAIVKEKPIYRSILQSVSRKLLTLLTLVSHYVFESDWVEIKRVLSLYYADKRDIHTLEHKLNQLSQG